jgi:RNA polymerase sigma-70 factor
MQANDENRHARAVFEILVRENEAMLMTYLRAVVGNQAAVEDLFQETMLTAWKKLSEFDRTRPFGPWLRGIAARLVMAHYRNTKHNFILGGEDMLEYVSRQIQRISEQSGDTWEEKTEALLHCIEALPDRYRKPIRLRYFEGEPAHRIAEVYKISLEAVKKRLQRARALLLDCLRRKKLLMEAGS